MSVLRPITIMLLGIAAAAVSPYASAQSSQAADCGLDVRDVNADCKDLVQAKARAGITPKAGAVIDLTGYWVSVVTEDWRWRMLTPPKGDVASLPLNDEGVRVTKLWDPQTESHNCKQFGAAGLLRNPLRIEFSWDDDKTLRLKTDRGMQTRVLYFNAAAVPTGGAPSMQGNSVAQWDQGTLKVVTTNLSAGYVRKNGVPYSDKAVLTEYFNRYTAFGADWLSVTTIVNDPTYFSREFITSSSFKKLPDGSAWRPLPCDHT